MEYKILHSDTLGELEALVNAYIEQGWKPQGGPFCFGQNDTASPEWSWCFCQALVK
jgi:hypothetical protein